MALLTMKKLIFFFLKKDISYKTSNKHNVQHKRQYWEIEKKSNLETNLDATVNLCG